MLLKKSEMKKFIKQQVVCPTTFLSCIELILGHTVKFSPWSDTEHPIFMGLNFEMNVFVLAC